MGPCMLKKWEQMGWANDEYSIMFYLSPNILYFNKFIHIALQPGEE